MIVSIGQSLNYGEPQVPDGNALVDQGEWRINRLLNYVDSNSMGVEAAQASLMAEMHSSRFCLSE